MEQLLGAFQRYFITIGKTDETVRSYSKSLRQFFREAAVSKVDDINRESLNNWIFVLRERDCRNQNIARHLWAIRAFLRWLKEEQGIDCYAFDLKMPRINPPETIEYLEPEEIERLFAVINTDTLCGLRLRVLIEVMLNTGLRPSETLSLKRSDMDAEEFDIIGKGGKRRKIYANDRVRQWIARYLARRTDDHPALFVTRNTKGGGAKELSLRAVQEEFQAHWLKTGMKKRVVLHTLRHTYATTLLANGCPLDYVAVLLGHSRPEITRRHYVSIQHKHAKAAHFRFLHYGEVSRQIEGGHGRAVIANGA